MGHQPKYLGHVNIFVRNVERSHRWYTEVSGCTLMVCGPAR